jgi:Tfp pilus assembly protein PilF
VTQPGKPRIWHYAVLLIAACLPYADLPTHGFLNWDDPWLVRDNPILAEAGVGTLRTIFFDLSPETRMTLGAEYLPLRDVSVMLGKQLWGDWAGGFLLVNLALYAGSVLLLFRLIASLHGSTTVALWSALLYAVHPIHVESVAWVSEHKAMLALFFGLASLVALETHLRTGSVRSLVAVCLFYLMALMGKYIAIVLPAFAALRLAWSWIDGELGPRPLRRAAMVLAPLAVISAGCLSVILRVGARADVLKERADHSLGVDLAMTVDVYRRYVVNLLFPVRLSPDYHVDPVSSPFGARGLMVLACVALTVALVVWLVFRIRRDGDPRWSTTLLWVAWFFAALLPVSQIAPIYNRMTDRYLLFPSIAFTTLAAYWGYLAWRRWRPRWLLVVAGVWVLALAGLTVRQVTFWDNSERLWERAAAMQPRSTRAWYQLSTTYQAQKRYADEGRALERALRNDPEYADALNNMGINLHRRGAPIEEVTSIYSRLFEQVPGHWQGMQNFGNALIGAGRYDDAIFWLQRSLSLQPRYCLAMLNLGRAYKGKGDAQNARRHLEQSLVCNPNMRGARRLLHELNDSGL